VAIITGATVTITKGTPNCLARFTEGGVPIRLKGYESKFPSARERNLKLCLDPASRELGCSPARGEAYLATPTKLVDRPIPNSLVLPISNGALSLDNDVDS
jgi:hypothetical protein